MASSVWGCVWPTRAIEGAAWPLLLATWALLLTGRAGLAGPAPLPPALEAAAAARQRSATSAEPQQPQGPEDFGRWEQPLKHCGISHQAKPGQGPLEQLSCDEVRLDQPLAGLLTVRFVQRAPDPRSMGQQLTITGVLGPGSQPMGCLDGSCQPVWPLRLEASAMAHTLLDQRGLSLSLPQARLVQGRCELQRQRFRCNLITSDNQQSWSVEAEF